MKQGYLIFSSRIFQLCIAIAFCLCIFSSGRAENTIEALRIQPQWALLSPTQASFLASEQNLSYAVPVAIVWLEPAPGYHTYAHEPGGDALPTTLVLEPPVPGSEIRYLPGEEKPDVFDPAILTRVYTKTTPIFILFYDGVPLDPTIRLSLLACSERNCVPMRVTLPLPPVEDKGMEIDGPLWTLLQLSQKEEASRAGLAELPQELAQNEIPLVPLDIPQTSIFSSSDPNADRGISPLSEPEQVYAFTPKFYQASLEVGGIGKAILLGLLAGLILNIMPCVLPVLSIKLASLLGTEGTDKERIRAFRQHAFYFAVGILTWFGALAVLFGVLGMVWGQLFQSSVVVFVLVLLVFCLGLSMFDVFHLPVLDLRTGTSGSPRMQAYLTGVFATLLATPCSGPLLGGVLGWSLLQSVPVLVLIFFATGLGMALPYLFMAWQPHFANRLPRPGPWMQALERVLGFLLMATALYLLSLLPANLLLPALSVLLLMAFLAWLWGVYEKRLSPVGRKLGMSMGVLTMLAGIWLALSPPLPREMAWQLYEDTSFRAQLGKEPLLVEFTADWCPTCKVLERTVLTDATLAPLAKDYGIRLIKVDMTQYDQDQHDLLRSLGSASIPLLAIFPQGEQSSSPLILRDIYTVAQLKEALGQALE